MRSSRLFRTRRGIALTLLATTMLCTSGGALAQDAADDEPRTADPAQPPDATVSADRLSADYGVDNLVTAQTLEANNQDDPVATPAITTKTLHDLSRSYFYHSTNPTTTDTNPHTTTSMQ